MTVINGMFFGLGFLAAVTVIAAAVGVRYVLREDPAPAAPAATPGERRPAEWWRQDGDSATPAKPLLPVALLTVPRRSGDYADKTGEFERVIAEMDATGQAGEAS